MTSNILKIGKKVVNALENNKPVIALESTIISHGMPYPQNLKVAKKLENIADSMGVVPATVCLMNGKIKIGVNEEELKILAQSSNVVKVSSRDLGKVLAEGRVGATTVAATMIAARLAGVKVFATGGIGGVHRSVNDTYDISTDLIEFSRNPVIVVSAGAKAILDLSKTLEFLETYGVPVYSFKTDIFPAFYSSTSDLSVEQINSVEAIAAIYKKNLELGLKQGMLIANPIARKDEITIEKMNKIIKIALDDAKHKGIKGKQLTPFLLAKIVELSDGDSLKTNIKLVENNVKLACKIAKVL